MKRALSGWNRLVIVVTVTYIAAIGVWIYGERRAINVFDQFDAPRPHYAFWEWRTEPSETAEEFLDAKEYPAPRSELIAIALLAPPAAFAFSIYSVLWIHRGFQRARQS